MPAAARKRAPIHINPPSRLADVLRPSPAMASRLFRSGTGNDVALDSSTVPAYASSRSTSRDGAPAERGYGKRSRGCGGDKHRKRRRPLVLPQAPRTAPTIAERWTIPVICSYLRQINSWRRNACEFLAWSKWFNKWGLFQNVLILLTTGGMLGVIFVDDDGFDWVGYVLGIIALVVTGFDQWFGLSDSENRYYWGAAQLNAMADQMYALLLSPFDTRPDPYIFQVAVSRRISDIYAVASGNTIELAPDIFTPDPYD